MRSVMQHSFAEVPRADIPRSSFNRSHGLKTTFDADYLVPILVDDIVPGDTFNVNASIFARLATPIHPIMDNLYIETFFFFVPYRLVWDNFEKFHGMQTDPGDSIDFSIPVLDGSHAVATGDLADYMGLPLGLDPATTTDISALPFRAYRLIWNEWFRDQNLQDSLDIKTDDTADNNSEVGFGEVPAKRGKRHDYFTSCLTAPQKGDAVSAAIGGLAPIEGIGIDNNYAAVTSQSDMVETGSTTQHTYSNPASFNGTHPSDLYVEMSAANSGYPLIYANLANAGGAVNINDLRLAFQTQRLLERDARSGTRYNEMILAHFGVTVPDFRVQRPEFLGGGSSQVNITPVAQTTYESTPTVENAKGNLAGFGTVSGTHGFTKSFTEHGVLIGLMNARADITYSQGVNRYWQKQTRYDFYYPVLAQIGEQAVLNQEIWHNSAGTDNTDVFGYQERYAEMRYFPSQLTGLMRPDATGSLSSWHLSEDFASLPTLGSTFIESNTGTPLDAAIAVSTEPHFIADIYFNMQCARPMPLYGVPGNLDHF